MHLSFLTLHCLSTQYHFQDLPGGVEKALQSSSILRKSIQRCLSSSVTGETAIGTEVQWLHSQKDENKAAKQ